MKEAKNELLQMMEDKYTELKADGKSENDGVIYIWILFIMGRHIFIRTYNDTVYYWRCVDVCNGRFIRV